MPDLRTLRKQLGLTQAQLATVLETRQATISDQERGKVSIRRERLLAVMYMVEHPEAVTHGQGVLGVSPRIIGHQ